MRGKRAWIICVLCLILAGLLMAWGLGGQTETAKSGARYVALIADDSGTDALQFKQGAQAACDELGATVSFLTAREPGDDGLRQLMAEAEAMDPDGVVLPQSVPTDRAALGRQLGQAALDAGATEFYAFHGGGEAELALLAGLKDALPALHAARCGAAEASALAAELPRGCAVFALNAGLTLAFAQTEHAQKALYGVDPGESRVALLRGGDAAGLAIEMPYAQGYLAVMALQPGAKAQSAPARVVTRETMYDSQNVKLMFPLLQ